MPYLEKYLHRQFEFLAHKTLEQLTNPAISRRGYTCEKYGSTDVTQHVGMRQKVSAPSWPSVDASLRRTAAERRMQPLQLR